MGLLHMFPVVKILKKNIGGAPLRGAWRCMTEMAWRYLELRPHMQHIEHLRLSGEGRHARMEQKS